MKKSAVAAVALVGTAALSGAAIMPGAATASSKPTTMHLVLHQTATHSLGKTQFGGTDRAMSHGKVVGYDTITGVYSRKTNSVTIDVAFALKGGIITLRVAQSGQSTKFTGRILGGTGKYAGATGTVRGHSPSQNSKKTYVTLRLR